MNSFESMRKKLEPVGMYRIIAGSNIYSELMAYNAGLELLNSRLDEMLRECFADTALTWGLSIPERQWGAVRSDLDTGTRRSMLLARSALNYGDFTPEGIGKVLCALGINGEVKEHPAVSHITVSISGGYTQGTRNWLQSQLCALLPAHLEVDAVFEGFDWNESDSRGLTFSEMESRHYSWQYIDLIVL